MIRVMTAAWGGYTWLVYPCLVALRRHWRKMPNAVSVFSDDYKTKLPMGVSHYTATMGWNPKQFSDRLRDMLQQSKEPAVYWTTPDTFWTDDVVGDEIFALACYMLERGDVVKMTIDCQPSLDGNHDLVCHVNGMDVVRCNNHRHCSYVSGMAMGPGLFNRDLLIQLLQPGWDIWDVERIGTDIMLRDERVCSLAVYPGLHHRVDVMTRNRVTSVAYMVDDVDKHLLRECAPKDVAL